MKRPIALFLKAIRSDFVKVSAWTGASTIVKMLSGFISIKVVANVIGPSGIALVGQFMNWIALINTVGTGGIGLGVTKYISQYYDEPSKQRSIIAHSLRVTLATTFLTSFAVIIFSNKLGFYIFGTNQYNSLIVFWGISISLFSLNSLMICILNGFKSFKKYVKVNIAISLVSLALTVFLVLSFGLYGALVNCVVTQSLTIIVTLIFLYKEPWFSSLFASIKIELGVIKKIGAFTIMALTSALLVPFTQLAIRSYITENLSLNNAGIWEGMNRLSGMYLMLITSSISIYYLPKLSEIKENYLLRQEIIKTAKIVLPPLALACISIYLLRDVLVWLIFSKEFTVMRDLFAFQMIGDFFKIASWLMALLFWAKSLTKIFIITEVVFNILYILIAYAGINNFGLAGSIYAYAFLYFIYFITMLIVFRHLIFNRRA